MKSRGHNSNALLAVLGWGLLCLPLIADETSATADQIEFFEREVRPLLVEHCYSCHSVNADKLQAGLLLDSRASLLAGGDSGEAIVPGDPESSLLIEAVRYESYEMPPSGKLSQKDIQTFERWVEMGSPWPQEAAPVAGEAIRPEFNLQQRKDEHWVWQPVRNPAIPTVGDSQWPRDDLDHFVLAKLDEAELHPAADVDKAALLRRLYFDLTGLPPDPQQAAQYLADESPGATERLVDELLQSPHFGERWGRHWLDLVRFAESRGHEFDNDIPNAFQYRDYIIRALNADVPYDQLVREHIAGDLLTEPRLNPQGGFNESILGTGFWFLGEWVHSPVDIRKDEADRFDNMIDAMSKTFLGVTVSCARCHDHKFDAISTADYYSLSGFLQSSDYRQVRFESLEHNRRIAQQLTEIDERYRRQIERRLADAGVSLPCGNDGNRSLVGLCLNDTVGQIDSEISEHVVVDFGNLSSDQYMQDGFIFGSQPRLAGTVFLSLVDEHKPAAATRESQPAGNAKRRRRQAQAQIEPTSATDGASTTVNSASATLEPELRFASASAAVSDAFWDGLQSVSEKTTQNKDKLFTLPRSGRTLRSPTFTLTDGNVACRVRGEGTVVACVDSHRLVAGPLHGETIRPISGSDEWVQLKLDRYVGHRLHLEFTPAETAQLEVLLVTQGASPEMLQKLTDRENAVAAMVAEFSETAAQALGADASRIARAWAQERSELQSHVKWKSRLALAMMDGSGEDACVLIRGNSSNPGEVEPRHFLTAITGDQPMKIKSRSGRLELAQHINDPANPLTSRVIVNRIWHYLMGRGIVPTTDDFGVLGQRPTHPELLDHLATRFVEDGQSIKRMIRTIVLSRTYQVSSHADATAIAADPKNNLWHYRPPKRLEGEAIRDALLSLAGRLDQTLFGASVPIHLTDFMDGRGRPGVSGPVDGLGRRSIYIALRRNFLSPFMQTFDAPTPFSTIGRRNVSNVPAQALILMNDPLVVELSKEWAQRAIDKQASAESRLQWMYQTAFSRNPTPDEQAIALAFLTTQAEERGVDKDHPQLWADLAHALVNTKEFIFLQ